MRIGDLSTLLEIRGYSHKIAVVTDDRMGRNVGKLKIATWIRSLVRDRP